MPTEAELTGDESEIFIAELNCKPETSSAWTSNLLTAVDAFGNCTGEIPAAAVGSCGVRYYPHAVDDTKKQPWATEEGEAAP